MFQYGIADSDFTMQAGVVPSVVKRPSESWDELLVRLRGYNPSDIHLSRVAGGFNSVIQVSTGHCLRRYGQLLGQTRVIARRRGEALSATLAGLAEKLTDSWWKTLSLDAEAIYGIGYELIPVSMVISDPKVVTITLAGQLSFMTERRPVEPPPERRPEWRLDLPIETLPGFRQPPPEPDPRFHPHPSLQPSGMHAMASNPDAGGRPAWGPLKPVDIKRLDRGLYGVDLQPSKVVGDVISTIKASYKHLPHPSSKSVDIVLDLSQAVIEMKPQDGDARILYDTLLLALEGELAAQVAPSAETPMTPTISLVGRNPANVSVAELADFEVRVFHVADGTRQAICAAFDVVPGCKGIIQDVRHFIGGSDYGVIHDEYVVERVLHHKWAKGGFDRSMTLAKKTSIRVKRNGNLRDEDAWVYGRLLLDSLDTVALEPQADLRGDVVYFDGQARGIVDRVVLSVDGTILTPDEVDLGPPEATIWAVNVVPSITVPWEPDPELRDFRTRAHNDGVRHLARPFARFPTSGLMPAVQYARTEAVLKRVFFLGTLPSIFS